MEQNYVTVTLCIAMSASVCVSVCLSVRDHVFGTTLCLKKRQTFSFFNNSLEN